jgi:hypothetical protein
MNVLQELGMHTQQHFSGVRSQGVWRNPSHLQPASTVTVVPALQCIRPLDVLSRSLFAVHGPSSMSKNIIQLIIEDHNRGRAMYAQVGRAAG